jgi:hypothetical protein
MTRWHLVGRQASENRLGALVTLLEYAILASDDANTLFSGHYGP